MKVKTTLKAGDTGVVKWFNYKNMYGFIAPDTGGEDIYVHHTNSVDGLIDVGRKVK